MDGNLAGCRILYTRSTAHYRQFCALVRPLGAEICSLPVLDTRVRLLDNTALQQLAAAEYLVFTSANAVRHLLVQYQPQAKQRLVAIGKQTAAALPFPEVLVAPPPYNSEALLSVWQPRQRKIAVITAPRGRMLLTQSLRSCNTVATVYSYERFNPSNCYPETFPLPDVVTVASRETLDNLCAIMPQSILKLLQYRTCVAAISASVARYAAQQAFQQCIFAENAAEISQIHRICHWWNITRSFFHD